MGTFTKSAHLYVPKMAFRVPEKKILRPLEYVQDPQNFMELPLVLSIYHFWLGF